MTDDTLRGGGMRELAAGAALCNDAELKYDEADQLFTRVGEPTEAALKVLVQKLGPARPDPNPSPNSNPNPNPDPAQGARREARPARPNPNPNPDPNPNPNPA